MSLLTTPTKPQILEQKNKLRVLNLEYKKIKKEVDLLRNKELEDVEENE